jgi:hypothetical protein
MKRVTALLLAAVIVAASSTSTDALNMVTAEATLDWTEFRFTTSGTLVVTGIENGMVHAFGSAPTTPITETGSAIAHASIDNGFLTATAGAATTGDGGSPNAGQASAVVLASITLFGTGTGSVVVTVPYQLSLVSVETDERDLTSAEANVSFEIGPGVSARGDARDAIDLDGEGSISRDGILTTASREFSNPTWGPLVSFSGTAQVSVTSAVPEDTSSLLLLAVGLLALAALLYTRIRTGNDVSQ